LLKDTNSLEEVMLNLKKVTESYQPTSAYVKYKKKEKWNIILSEN
jgi:hypothetical protein